MYCQEKLVAAFAYLRINAGGSDDNPYPSSIKIFLMDTFYFFDLFSYGGLK
jgi:hypothetical protein